MGVVFKFQKIVNIIKLQSRVFQLVWSVDQMDVEEDCLQNMHLLTISKIQADIFQMKDLQHQQLMLSKMYCLL
jgi:hypothetical protein